MRKFNNIILSPTEPSTNDIWIKDGYLNYHNAGMWQHVKADAKTIWDDFGEQYMEGFLQKFYTAISKDSYLLEDNGGLYINLDKLTGDSGTINVSNELLPGYNRISEATAIFMKLFKYFTLKLTFRRGNFVVGTIAKEPFIFKYDSSEDAYVSTLTTPVDNYQYTLIISVVDGFINEVKYRRTLIDEEV